MRGRRSVVARLASVGAGALLLVAGCSTSSAAHTETPSSSTQADILHVVKNAFFSTTGASPDLRMTGLEEVVEGSTDWVRARFSATPKAPVGTRQAVAGGHSQGLLRQQAGRGWTWLGYLTPGASCRSAGRSASRAVAGLLHLPPACARAPAPSGAPPAAVTGGAVNTTLSSGDLGTLLSIFVTSKNSGPAGQVLTPTTIMVSQSPPPRAAALPDETRWAMVTFVPAPGAPEPLTQMQLQNGGGTAFYSKQSGQAWEMRGLAGQHLCSGARSAQVPPSALTLWGEHC